MIQLIFGPKFLRKKKTKAEPKVVAANVIEIEIMAIVTGFIREPVPFGNSPKYRHEAKRKKGRPSERPTLSMQIYIRLLMEAESLDARINGVLAKKLLDAEKLIVLSDAFGAVRGSGLDLTGVKSNNEIGD